MCALGTFSFYVSHLGGTQGGKSMRWLEGKMNYTDKSTKGAVAAQLGVWLLFVTLRTPLGQ